jgi:hypothetical protein
MGHTQQRGARTVKGGEHSKGEEAQTATWGTYGGGADGNGGVHNQRVCTRAPLMMGCSRTPCGWHEAHTYMPIIGGANGGAHGSKEEGIYVLPSSFEVAKPSPPGSLPSTCKVLGTLEARGLSPSYLRREIFAKVF